MSNTVRAVCLPTMRTPTADQRRCRAVGVRKRKRVSDRGTLNSARAKCDGMSTPPGGSRGGSSRCAGAGHGPGALTFAMLQSALDEGVQPRTARLVHPPSSLFNAVTEFGLNAQNVPVLPKRVRNSPACLPHGAACHLCCDSSLAPNQSNASCVREGQDRTGQRRRHLCSREV